MLTFFFFSFIGINCESVTTNKSFADISSRNVSSLDHLDGCQPVTIRTGFFCFFLGKKALACLKGLNITNSSVLFHTLS